MSDIFLSYASEDHERVRLLVRALERHGWSVWWDRTIPPGKMFDQVIGAALDAARCVVVVWSSVSVASHWVRTEAEEGRQRNVLVPVLIEPEVRLPLAFRLIQAAHLVDWQDTGPHPEFARLLQALTDLIGPPVAMVSVAPGVDTPTQPQAEAPLASNAAPPVSFTLQERSPRSEPTQVLAPEAQRRDTPEPVSVPQTVTNSLGMEFMLIPAGEFLMGSRNGDDDERPVHTVRLSRAFYLGKYVVTQGQWEAVMGTNPCRFKGDPNRPAETVSWEDAQEFIRKLNAREGGTQYRLPTEAEWEYAARAGSTMAYSFGDDTTQLDAYAWYGQNAGGTTHPVGQLQPNAWGLYDMHGNVWEWVQDWYGAYAAETAVDPPGPASGSRRVNRGGSWRGGAAICRSAYRGRDAPGYRNGNLGLRLLRTAR